MSSSTPPPITDISEDEANDSGGSDWEHITDDEYSDIDANDIMQEISPPLEPDVNSNSQNWTIPQSHQLISRQQQVSSTPTTASSSRYFWSEKMALLPMSMSPSSTKITSTKKIGTVPPTDLAAPSSTLEKAVKERHSGIIMDVSPMFESIFHESRKFVGSFGREINKPVVKPKIHLHLMNDVDEIRLDTSSDLFNCSDNDDENDQALTSTNASPLRRRVSPKNPSSSEENLLSITIPPTLDHVPFHVQVATIKLDSISSIISSSSSPIPPPPTPVSSVSLSSTSSNIIISDKEATKDMALRRGSISGQIFRGRFLETLVTLIARLAASCWMNIIPQVGSNGNNSRGSGSSLLSLPSFKDFYASSGDGDGSGKGSGGLGTRQSDLEAEEDMEVESTLFLVHSLANALVEEFADGLVAVC
ncbi:hypothetical protein HDU76_011375 [Blyttiomyces sp. JEL0837]|nr:hypothetical protein HDU76_011375 [Blyttiomyces sp. JEL0837]